MTPDTSGKPGCSAEPIEPITPRSGEGADTAFEAMIRKRKLRGDDDELDPPAASTPHSDPNPPADSTPSA